MHMLYNATIYPHQNSLFDTTGLMYKGKGGCFNIESTKQFCEIAECLAYTCIGQYIFISNDSAGI